MQKREEFTFIPGITTIQYAVLTQAFSDAIFLALNAIEPPTAMPIEQRNRIFNNYFPPDAQEIIQHMYSGIVGGDIHRGSAVFSHLVVDVNDSSNICNVNGVSNYINRNGTIITVCPKFWTSLGDLPAKTCADLSGDIVSWQMASPGSAIFALLLGYIGENAIEGKSIIYYSIKDQKVNFEYTGPALAMGIRRAAPDFAKVSVTNYEWYALVSYLLSKADTESDDD